MARAIRHAAYDFVSTHSRAKAAEQQIAQALTLIQVSTHSRAKAADLGLINLCINYSVSTHSRAKAADHSGLERPRL